MLTTAFDIIAFNSHALAHLFEIANNFKSNGLKYLCRILLMSG